MVQVLGTMAVVMVVLARSIGAAEVSGSPVASEPDMIAAALQQGYMANRDAFRQFSCRFVVKRGKAATKEDALAGRLSEVVIRNGVWVVDGILQRYELICEDPKTEIMVPPAASVENKPLVLTSVQCISEKNICNGSLGLAYSPKLLAANIGAGFGAEPPITYTPLSFGIMGNNESYGPKLRERAGVNVIRRYGGVKNLNGKQLECLVVGESDSWYKEWWLDDSQGFIPIEVMFYLGNEVLEGCAVVTHVRKCVNDAYFPERSVTILTPNGSGPKDAWVIELRELELTRPTETDFSIEVAAGTQIVEAPTMLARIRVRGAQAIGLQDLEELVERCRGVRRTELDARKLASPQTKRGWGRTLLFVAGSLTLLLICGLLVVGRRRVRGGPP
jgi:hypothetical protein